MIYTPRYIFNSDLEKIICTCVNSKKYRILFSHSNSIENTLNNSLIGVSSQIVAICSKCGKIYKFQLKYNPSINSKIETKNVQEIAKDIFKVKEDVVHSYKSYEEVFSFKSKDLFIKILNEEYDNDKKCTEFMYIEK